MMTSPVPGAVPLMEGPPAGAPQAVPEEGPPSDKQKHPLLKWLSFRPRELVSPHYLYMPYNPRPPLYLYFNYPPLLCGPGHVYPCGKVKTCWNGCAGGAPGFGPPGPGPGYAAAGPAPAGIVAPGQAPYPTHPAANPGSFITPPAMYGVPSETSSGPVP